METCRKIRKGKFRRKNSISLCLWFRSDLRCQTGWITKPTTIQQTLYSLKGPMVERD